MSSTALEISRMIDMLPESEQSLAYEFVKRIVLAWDPDFTKATPEERIEMEKADQEIACGEVVSFEEINWD